MEKKGKKNLYNCKSCGNTIITQNLDDGVTPMFLFCGNYGGCDSGSMVSMMYNVPQDNGVLVAGYEWYRPEKLAGLSDGEKAHIQAGGMLLRKRTPAEKEDPLKEFRLKYEQDLRDHKLD